MAPKSLYVISLIVVLLTVGVAGPAPDAFAQVQEYGSTNVYPPPRLNPADPLVDEQIEQAWHPAYLSLATGDPSLISDHGVYIWPFDLDSIGWSMQSYQNYGGTPYFHHGMDMMKMWGTQVFNRSGGQVINIENYNPSYLYWEVAVLDPEGYIWQYHHIQMETIPQFIWDKYAEYVADPVNGGFIPPDTHLGNIVEWPVWSFGKQFNHIHLNILAEGGVFVNGFEFHDPLPDTVGPEIQGLGLVQAGQILPGDTVEGDYSLYVHARDLILDNVYYLPPWEITFSVDGGPVQTTWRFDTLPGGWDDTAYLDDFYMVPPTCGDYECRDYYIDLGFIPDSQYVFPATGGQHSIQVWVKDYAGSTASQTFTYMVVGPPPGTPIWQDDFETDKGWVTNPDGTDTATLGLWERGDPESTYSNGAKQLGTTPSGLNDLVTGRLAGASPGSYDIDGGVTSIRSPEISLPNAQTLTVSFRYYLSHADNSSNADYLRLSVVGEGTTTVFEELGAAENDNGSWSLSLTNLDAFRGQTVYLLISAADEDSGSLVEAAIDDVQVYATEPNQAPVADPQSLSTPEDTSLDLILTGSDPDGDPLTYTVATNPLSGTLSGIAPNLVYTPNANFNGDDSFTFTVSDGLATSQPATISIQVTPVNDAPVANPQSMTIQPNSPVQITLTGFDIDGDGLSYMVIISPTHGTLDGTAPDLTYTPYDGYGGLDSFTFLVNDGELDSLPAQVSLTIGYRVYVPVTFK